MSIIPVTGKLPTNHLLSLPRYVAFFLMTTYEALSFYARSVGRPEAQQCRASTYIGGRWGRRLLRMMGIRLTSSGPTPPTPALLAPNHAGYLDIFAVIGTCDAFMLARVEVSRWPIMGRVVTDSCHPLVSRERNRAISAAGEGISKVLKRGDRICVFLEGTSTGHDRVLPFRPSFVQPAIDLGAPIVPVGIRWKATVPGVDIGEDVSYWKDHVIGPHFWRLCGLKGIEVEVVYGEPIPSAGRNRKELAEEVRREAARLSGLPCIDTPGWQPAE